MLSQYAADYPTFPSQPAFFSGADSYFAGTPLLARVHHVISRAPTKAKTGERRQLMVLDAKRAFLHDDALADTYVKPPHLRDTERCLRLTKCMYDTFPAAVGSQREIWTWLFMDHNWMW